MSRYRELYEKLVSENPEMTRDQIMLKFSDELFEELYEDAEQDRIGRFSFIINT